MIRTRAHCHYGAGAPLGSAAFQAQYAGLIAGSMAIPLTVGIAMISEYPIKVGMATVAFACLTGWTVHVATEETDPKSSLKLLAQAKSAVGDGVTVDTRVLYTESVHDVTGIGDTLANGTREWGADLVVLGSSHRQALEL